MQRLLETKQAKKIDAAPGQQSANKIKSSEYWNSLDGVRALAVLLVFMHHLGPYPSTHPNLIALAVNKVSEWGWIGVDFFFVLSGFLITFLLIKEQKSTNGISAKGFYLRRMLRIWPLYYGVLALAFVVVPLCAPQHPAPSQWFDFAFRVGAPFAFFVGNYSLITDTPTISVFEKQLNLSIPWLQGILMPLWSLSIEEQFYLAWPWILKKWHNPKTLIKIVLGAVACSALLRLAVLFTLLQNSSTLHGWYYSNAVTRLDPIMIGALIAVLASQKPLEHRVTFKGSTILSIATLLSFVCLVAYFPPIQSVKYIHVFTLTSCALIGGGLLITALAPGPMKGLFSTPALVFIGKRSYAFYLFHNIVLMFTDKCIMPLLHVARPTTAWWVMFCISLPLTILLSHLSLILVEQPFLKLRTRFRYEKS